MLEQLRQRRIRTAATASDPGIVRGPEGDLATAAEAGSAPELAELFPDLADSLLQATLSGEISSSRATTVAMQAERMSDNVVEMSTTMEQFSASINEIAHSTSAASAMAQQTADASAASQDLVRALGGSTQEIGSMVDLINRIAGQTDLLALNATIEAARAGEIGKGFAVVAHEVKELARATAEATATITRTVERLQSDVLAAATSISNIDMLVQQFAEQQSSIAAAVEEQSATSVEVGRVLGALAGESEGLASVVASLAESAYRATFSASEARASMARVVAVPALSEVAGQEIVFPTPSQLDAAIGAHADWKAKLVNALEHGGAGLDPAAIRPDVRCAFGKWLHGSIDPEYRRSSDYSHVVTHHARFHQIAADIVTLAQQGRVDEARQLLAHGSEFAVTSSTLTGLIDGWRA
ncbi:MAG: methyl-accepting chemotaxis protein [Ilumatobacteraceae bacterium]